MASAVQAKQRGPLRVTDPTESDLKRGGGSAEGGDNYARPGCFVVLTGLRVFTFDEVILLPDVSSRSRPSAALRLTRAFV